MFAFNVYLLLLLLGINAGPRWLSAGKRGLRAGLMEGLRLTQANRSRTNMQLCLWVRSRLTRTHTRILWIWVSECRLLHRLGFFGPQLCFLAGKVKAYNPLPARHCSQHRSTALAAAPPAHHPTGEIPSVPVRQSAPGILSILFII